ncbi:MAG: helix-turn-helix transcriptional regulator [Bdellovibrionota bacterium]
MDVDSLSSDIGKCLQWLRKSLLLTQYQLASFTELDYRHYQNIESGRVEVKVETLKRICSSFGIGLSTFFYLLDRKPWTTETVTRTRGSGDLYLYRMVLEQAKFRLLSPVRDFVFEWGRAIAEGNRDTLRDCPRPCIEVDSEFRILWKNTSASDTYLDGERDLTQIVFDDHLDELSVASRDFWESKSNSFYIELSISPKDQDRYLNCAFVALRPMVNRPDQTIFLGMVEIGHEPLEVKNDRVLRLQNANRIFMS